MKKDGILPGLARTFDAFSRTLLARVYQITKALANIRILGLLREILQKGKTLANNM
jgi:hypothetical protein